MCPPLQKWLLAANESKIEIHKKRQIKSTNQINDAI